MADIRPPLAANHSTSSLGERRVSVSSQDSKHSSPEEVRRSNLDRVVSQVVMIRSSASLRGRPKPESAPVDLLVPLQASVHARDSWEWGTLLFSAHETTAEWLSPSVDVVEAETRTVGNFAMFAQDFWGLSEPQTVFSITGSARDFAPKVHDQLRSLFLRAVARSTVELGAWVVDGGTDCGIMQLTGRAFRDRGRPAVHLGIAYRPKVFEGDRLTNRGQFEYHSERAQPGPVQAALEPNHTHFLLVPRLDSVGGGWGGDAMFTGRFLRELLPDLPRKAVLLVAGGGVVTTSVACEWLGVAFVSPSGRANPLPRAVPYPDRALVCFQGSGGFASDLATAHSHYVGLQDSVRAAAQRALQAVTRFDGLATKRKELIAEIFAKRSAVPGMTPPPPPPQQQKKGKSTGSYLVSGFAPPSESQRLLGAGAAYTDVDQALAAATAKQRAELEKLEASHSVALQERNRLCQDCAVKFHKWVAAHQAFEALLVACSNEELLLSHLTPIDTDPELLSTDTRRRQGETDEQRLHRIGLRDALRAKLGLGRQQKQQQQKLQKQQKQQQQRVESASSSSGSIAGTAEAQPLPFISATDRFTVLVSNTARDITREKFEDFCLAAGYPKLGPQQLRLDVFRPPKLEGAAYFAWHETYCKIVRNLAACLAAAVHLPPHLPGPLVDALEPFLEALQPRGSSSPDLQRSRNNSAADFFVLPNSPVQRDPPAAATTAAPAPASPSTADAPASPGSFPFAPPPRSAAARAATPKLGPALAAATRDESHLLLGKSPIISFDISREPGELREVLEAACTIKGEVGAHDLLATPPKDLAFATQLREHRADLAGRPEGGDEKEPLQWGVLDGLSTSPGYAIIDQSKGQYQDMSALFNELAHRWALRIPSTVVTVVGADGTMELGPDAQLQVTAALTSIVDGVSERGGLFLDDGLPSFAKHVAGTVALHRRIPYIGVVDVNRAQTNLFQADAIRMDVAPRLGPQHSNFVLAQMTQPESNESAIAGIWSEFHQFLGSIVPTVTVLSGGTLADMSQVLACIRQARPVIVFRGSGGLADLISLLLEARATRPSAGARGAAPPSSPARREGHPSAALRSRLELFFRHLHWHSDSAGLVPRSDLEAWHPGASEADCARFGCSADHPPVLSREVFAPAGPASEALWRNLREVIEDSDAHSSKSLLRVLDLRNGNPPGVLHSLLPLLDRCFHQASFTDLIVRTLASGHSAAQSRARDGGAVTDTFGEGEGISVAPHDLRLHRMIYHGHLQLAESLIRQHVGGLANSAAQFHADGRSMSLIACCVRHKSRPLAAKLAGMLLDKGASCKDLSEEERTTLLDMTLQVSDKESSSLREQILASFMFLAVDLAWSGGDADKGRALLAELLGFGADLSWEVAGETVLDIASRTGQTEIADFLLTQGAKVNIRNRVAVYAAMSLLHRLAAELAAGAGAEEASSPEPAGKAPEGARPQAEEDKASAGAGGAGTAGTLPAAIDPRVRARCVRVIRCLLENQIESGAYKINFSRGRFSFQNPMFRTVLESAVIVGDSRCVELLMQRGVCPVEPPVGPAEESLGSCRALELAIDLDAAHVAEVLLRDERVAGLLRKHSSPYLKQAAFRNRTGFIALPRVQVEMMERWNRVVLARRLWELLGYVVFLVVLTNVIVHRSTGNNLHHHFMARAVRQTFADPPFRAPGAASSASFWTLGGVGDAWTWLQGPLLDGVYSPELANTLQLVGAARVSQVRVREHSCEVPAKFRSVVPSCRAPFSASAESREPFGGENASSASSSSSSDGPTPWVFSTSAEPFSALWYWGELTSYPYRGFQLDLGRSVGGAATDRELLVALQESAWIDSGTRAVFVDLNLFNPHLNRFGAARLAIEFPASGGTTARADVAVVHLHYYDTRSDLGVIAAELLVVLMLVAFWVNRTSSGRVRELFSHSQTWIELGITALIGLVICLRIAVHAAVGALDFDPSTRAFVPVRSVASLSLLTTNVTAFLALVAWLHLLNHLTVLRTFGLLLIIIRKMLGDLARFLGFFLVILIGIALAFHVSMGSDLYRYRSFGDSVMGVFLIVFGEIDPDRVFASNRIASALLIFFTLIVLTIVALNLLIAMLNDSYIRVQGVAELEWKLAHAKLILTTLDSCKPHTLELFEKPDQAPRKKWRLLESFLDRFRTAEEDQGPGGAGAGNMAGTEDPAKAFPARLEKIEEMLGILHQKMNTMNVEQSLRLKEIETMLHNELIAVEMK